MSFSRVIGHAAEIETLKLRLRQGRMPHALLFTGPRGIGKRRIASALSAALLCGKGDDACGDCPACRKTAGAGHPDFLELGPAEKPSIGIQEVRALIAKMHLKPFESCVKISVIDEAQCLTDEAQNALLKILEEPPGPAYVMLVTPEPEGLAATIRSRCRRVAFRPLAAEELRRILALGGRERADAAEISKFLEGTLERANRFGGANPKKIYERVFEDAAAAPEGRARSFSDRPKAPREEVLIEIDALADFFRDLLLIKAGAPARLFFSDRAERLRAAAARLSFDAAARMLETIGERREEVGQGLNQRLVLARLWRDAEISFQ